MDEINHEFLKRWPTGQGIGYIPIWKTENSQACHFGRHDLGPEDCGREVEVLKVRVLNASCYGGNLQALIEEGRYVGSMALHQSEVYDTEKLAWDYVIKRYDEYANKLAYEIFKLRNLSAILNLSHYQATVKRELL